MTIRGTALICSALVVGLLLYLIIEDSSSGVVEEPQASSDSEDGKAGLDAHEGNHVSNGGGHTPTTNGTGNTQPTVPEIERLWDAAPLGKVSEWPVSHLGTPKSATHVDVSTIFHRTVISAPIESAPFRAVWMYGPSDLPWLRKFQKACYAEFNLVVQQRLSGEAERALVDDIQVRYRQVLTDIALKRFNRHAELVAAFDDDTALRDMEPGSIEARRLEALLDMGFRRIWVYPDLVPERLRAVLSARDIPMLKNYASRVKEIQQRGRLKRESEAETARKLRDILSELGRYLKSRE